MDLRANKLHVDYFRTLTSLLGVDQDSLLDYLNWCLLEHLVGDLAQNREWITRTKSQRNAIALFRDQVERRTNCKWDTENVTVLYDRVKASTEKHFRQPITYNELLRLLINSPLKCAEPTCGKTPPEVKLHIDHIFPAARGGSSVFENLQFLCANCNLRKSDKLPKSHIWLKLESLRPL
jgi:5-methylcytosine-specific restriction endonuclease McrA